MFGHTVNHIANRQMSKRTSSRMISCSRKESGLLPTLVRALFFDVDRTCHWLAEVKSFLNLGCQNSPKNDLFSSLILGQARRVVGRADLGNFFENVEILHKEANFLSGIIGVNYSPHPHFYGLITIFLVSIILVGWAIWADGRLFLLFFHFPRSMDPNFLQSFARPH